MYPYTRKAFRFSENLPDLFFLLLPHKFLSIAYIRLVNFNAEKRKRKSRKFGNLGILSIDRETKQMEVTLGSEVQIQE
jgi:hypothetical protein